MPAPTTGPDRSSAQAIAQAWIAAVSAGDWTALVPLFPPANQARARRDVEALTEEQKAKLQATARTLTAAMAAKPPEFVRVEAVLAEPTHHEWYFCGRKPQGQFWAPPCAVSVIDLDGRWYLLDVIDNPDAD
jgi:hypothetical protein